MQIWGSKVCDHYNGGEWMTKFDMMCKNFGITNQFTTP